MNGHNNIFTAGNIDVSFGRWEHVLVVNVGVDFVLNAADFDTNIAGSLLVPSGSWRSCLLTVEVYENAWPTMYFALDLKDSSFGRGILKDNRRSLHCKRRNNVSYADKRSRRHRSMVATK